MSNSSVLGSDGPPESKRCDPSGLSGLDPLDDLLPDPGVDGLDSERRVSRGRFWRHDSGVRWCIKQGYMDRNPILDIEIPKTFSRTSSDPGELLTPRFMHRHAVNDTHDHVCFEYLARSTTREVSQGETEISEEIRWFTQEDLNDPKYDLRTDVREHASIALDELGSKK